ncbi:hypothetical protein K490DRAFT_66401 [Saccharata proteae CBS 121410]|uniref:F-box domain-containing protein n=1 Tax=Saccharata proteae CBS 121410 TaxID=1314787 RepID=A0A9P4HVD0_9PEZI|nr:hypothetical protein K490DRAFT_66401 [Saccharata proteae CBS 121410]
MDRLSQELIASIIRYLYNSEKPHPSITRLHKYATVSRSWQYAVERITFCELHIQSSELSHCLDTLRSAQKHRRSLIKQLDLEIILPDYSDEVCLEGETDQEIEDNSRAFTEAVRKLFQIVRVLDTPSNGLHVALSNLRAPNDDVHPKMYNRERFPGGFHPQSTWTARYRGNFVELLEPEALPLVTGVSTFTGDIKFPRNVEPASIVDIATKFQNLEEFTIFTFDYRTFGKEARVKNRTAFAESLLSFRELPLQKLVIDTRTQGQTDERAKIKFFHLPGTTDPLSRALHRVFQNLTSLQLLGCHIISPELFWPSDAESTHPSWPNLRSFSVQFDPRTPHGDWYFMRDPDAPMHPEYVEEYEPFYINPAEDGDGEPAVTANETAEGSKNEANDGAKEGDDGKTGEHENDNEADKDGNNSDNEDGEDDSDDDTSSSSSFDTESSGSDHGGFREMPEAQFRGRPKPATINPLLIAAARAVRCMLRLNDFELSTPTRDDLYDDESHRITTRRFGLTYQRNYRRTDREDSTLTWLVGKWRPDDEVEACWRETIGPNGEFFFK